jgi:hypothetical protein
MRLEYDNANDETMTIPMSIFFVRDIDDEDENENNREVVG